jgi:hypothetical protein
MLRISLRYFHSNAGAFGQHVTSRNLTAIKTRIYEISNTDRLVVFFLLVGVSGSALRTRARTKELEISGVAQHVTGTRNSHFTVLSLPSQTLRALVWTLNIIFVD